MRKLVLFVISLITIASSAQDTLTLQRAIEMGLNNNYQIRISYKELAIDQNNNTWGTAGRYPTITFNTAVSGVADRYADASLLQLANENLADTVDVNTQQSLFITPSVNLNWVLFNGMSVNINKAKLAYIEQLSEGNTAIVVENTLQSILLAYHIVLVQGEALEVLNEVKILSRDRYGYVKARKEFGNAVTFDVLQAENNYLADSANALRQEINYKNALRNLNLVLAEPVDQEYILTDEMIEYDREFLFGDLISKLESNNKTLQNQYVNQEILKKNVSLSKSELYPTVSLSAGFGRTYTGLYGDLENYYWDDDGYSANAQLSLTYTLSNGGNVRRTIRNAKIQQEIGELRIEEMKQALYNQLFNTYEQYTIKRQLLHVSDANVKSARLNLQIAEEKYKSGAINSFNYRDIQLIYLNAVRDQLEAKYNVIESFTELLRLTGGIITEYE
ncbi:MAG: TolC family protein [Bacteroidales bacterium]|jgi:outer membrane protein TolC